MASSADFPPGFVPTAFWFFPDWGEEDYTSRLGFKEPFWMKDIPKKVEKQPVNKDEDIIRQINSPFTNRDIKYCFNCHRRMTERNEFEHSGYCLDCIGTVKPLLLTQYSPYKENKHEEHEYGATLFPASPYKPK